jgi:hypothetical protein
MIPTWEKVSTSGLGMQFLLGKILLSGRRIEIYLGDSGSFLLEYHSPLLVETIIFQPKYYMISAWQRFSSFGRRMMEFFGRNFQLPAG